MKLRQLALLPLLSVLIACNSEPYPFPPQFVSTEQVAPTVLPTPPAVGSKEYNHEIDVIIARQAKLTDKQKTVIYNENHISPEMMVIPVLGKQYTEASYPALYSLLRHASSDAWRISDATEDYWNSPRPWYADKRVELLVPTITRPGYPSGHTTTNCVWAYVLSDLFPAKHDALFARAIQIGNHRIDGGAHFPHDIEGGKKIAKVIYAKMKQSPAYQRELTAARQELQNAN